MKSIQDDIKNKSFRPVYLLYGEEGYLITQFKNKLITAILGEDTINLSTYRDKPDFDEIYETSRTLPFLAERRVIVLDRCDMFKRTNDEFEALLKNIPDYITFIITEDKADKRRTLYKIINSAGYVCELKTQSQADVASFIKGRCEGEGKKISDEAVREIYSRTCGDLGLISSELEKLYSYTFDREEISLSDVRDICSVRVEERVFDMIDAICYKDKKKALTLYYDLLAVKESSYKILSLLESHFRGLLQVSDSPRMPLGELAKSIGMKGVAPFVAGRYLKQAGSFTKERLGELVKGFAQTQEAIKTGRINEKIGVELMIAEALL